jgi:hypothetical protein
MAGGGQKRNQSSDTVSQVSDAAQSAASTAKKAASEATSTITYPDGQRANLVTTAHANGTRCIISFGGAGDNDANWRTAIGANRTTAVNNIMNLVTTNGKEANFIVGADVVVVEAIFQTRADPG